MEETTILRAGIILALLILSIGFFWRRQQGKEKPKHKWRSNCLPYTPYDLEEVLRDLRKYIEEQRLAELKKGMERDLIGMTDRSGLAIMNTEE